jgi:hypothetical protein
MNSLLIDELSQTGLQTISIIFNSSSRFNGSKWETIKNDEGQQLYKELSLSMNYRIDEVHSTVWQNGHGLRKDTCFSVNMEFPFIKKRNEVKLVIRQILNLTCRYSCAQVIVNNSYPLNTKSSQTITSYAH